MHRLIMIACAALAVARPASGQDHELWNKQQVLTALLGLSVAPEAECSEGAVSSSAWAGQQEQIAELHEGLLSPYDGIVFPNFHYVQIEHIVARKEADESGMCSRGEEARTAFAADLLNLTLAPGSLNASKGDGDAHDIQEAEASLFRDNLTPHGRCWWAAQSVRVKSKYSLTVNSEEKAAMQSLLDACTDEQVYRPKLAARSDWMFRAEFLDALTDEDEIRPCSDQVVDTARLQTAAGVASPYLVEMACLPYVLPSGRPATETPATESPDGTTTGEQPPDPRAAQIAAQRACISTLEEQGLTKTCTNVSTACPAVEPILTAEPLYEFLTDADSDGTVCESL